MSTRRRGRGVATLGGSYKVRMNFSLQVEESDVQGQRGEISREFRVCVEFDFGKVVAGNHGSSNMCLVLVLCAFA